MPAPAPCSPKKCEHCLPLTIMTKQSRMPIPDQLRPCRRRVLPGLARGIAYALLVGTISLGCARGARPQATVAHGLANQASTHDSVNSMDTSVAGEIARPALEKDEALNPPLALQWLPDGKRIRVSLRWLLSVDEGTFSNFACALEPEKCENISSISFSSDGSRAVLLGETKLSFGPSGGPFENTVRIPRWTQSRDGRPATFNHLGFWTSRDSVFVQQFDRNAYNDPRGPIPPECRLYNTAERKWQQLRDGCIQGDYLWVGEVEAGPADLVAVRSSSEGSAALGFYRYRVAEGQSQAIRAPVSLGSEEGSIAFTKNGAWLLMITSCSNVQQSPRAQDCATSTTWSLYRVPTMGGAIELRRSDLPRGAVIDPDHDRFAWPSGDGVCVGDPRDPKARCFPLPSEKSFRKP
jgi:hypothetical protein